MAKKEITQHIAVFGESGSGKTVLISSFFGATREQSSDEESLYDLVAEDSGQSKLLLQNYYGMKNSSTAPRTNRRKGIQYGFALKVKPSATEGTTQSSPTHTVRVTWHDYPGDWFESSASGPEDTRRRVETFRNLLESDVALLLVDAQKLKDHSGEEERYLKSLFANVNNTLLALRSDLLDGKDKLVTFPRIWMLALSKADLMPSMSARDFEALVLEKAADDLITLRSTLASMVEGEPALDVGEDFILLSSAKFEPGVIDVSRRVGLDLVLPVATVLPLERHARWTEKAMLPAKVAEHLANNIAVYSPVLTVIASLINKIPLPGPFGVAKSMLTKLVPPATVPVLVTAVGQQLETIHQKALEKKQVMAAIVTGFKISLEDAEKAGTLVRSKQ